VKGASRVYVATLFGLSMLAIIVVGALVGHSVIHNEVHREVTIVQRTIQHTVDRQLTFVVRCETLGGCRRKVVAIRRHPRAVVRHARARPIVRHPVYSTRRVTRSHARAVRTRYVPAPVVLRRPLSHPLFVHPPLSHPVFVHPVIVHPPIVHAPFR